MKDLTEMNTPEEFIAEAEITDRRLEELREHRILMLGRLNSSKRLARLMHNFNFILSEKQIVRHLRFFKMHRDRIEVHYERIFGEEMPDPAVGDQPGPGLGKGSTGR